MLFVGANINIHKPPPPKSPEQSPIDKEPVIIRNEEVSSERRNTHFNINF